MRCPLALIKSPYVQASLDLFADYQQGITPQGRGICRETAAYRAMIRTLSSFSNEAEAWFSRESMPKKGGR
jgi:hypothetical protein